jgi:class 3 adenylate cyclase
MAELPSGTVTLLFSDVEGSTRLLRQLGERWPEAHAAHRRILREAFLASRGREVDTQGDAFFAVFASARDALAGAVSAQRGIRAAPWPDGTKLRVRMGVHTGEPVVGEEGYLGLDVVRGARICAAAHGGQVLVSETTRAIVRGDEPAETELRDLGEHHLKDLEHAERLYQLVAPGLPSDFPAPRSLDSDSGPQVPLPALRIAGRERELAEQAVAAARDLHGLGPAIERQVDDALRAAGLSSDAGAPAHGRRGRFPGLGWVLVLVALAVVGVWLLLRIL